VELWVWAVWIVVIVVGIIAITKAAFSGSPGEVLAAVVRTGLAFPLTQATLWLTGRVVNSVDTLTTSLLGQADPLNRVSDLFFTGGVVFPLGGVLVVGLMLLAEILMLFVLMFRNVALAALVMVGPLAWMLFPMRGIGKEWLVRYFAAFAALLLTGPLMMSLLGMITSGLDAVNSIWEPAVWPFILGLVLLSFAPFAVFSLFSFVGGTAVDQVAAGAMSRVSSTSRSVTRSIPRPRTGQAPAGASATGAAPRSASAPAAGARRRGPRRPRLALPPRRHHRAGSSPVHACPSHHRQVDHPAARRPDSVRNRPHELEHRLRHRATGAAARPILSGHRPGPGPVAGRHPARGRGDHPAQRAALRALGLLYATPIYLPLGVGAAIRTRGMSLPRWVAVWLNKAFRDATGANREVFAPEKVRSAGTLRLPGRLGAIELWDVDGMTCVYDPHGRSATIMAELEVPGFLMKDLHERFDLAEKWALVLASFTQRAGIKRVTMQERTTPATIQVARDRFAQRTGSLDVPSATRRYQAVMDRSGGTPSRTATI
jgi:hypothetical protein